jgi:hypothetical protein
MATSTTTAPSVPPANQEYQQRADRVATLTNLTLQSTDGTTRAPTPTQMENDLLALGLMDIDNKAPRIQNEVMPPLAAQQAYLRDGTALPSAPTGATGASGASGASGATGASGASGASGATGAS